MLSRPRVRSLWLIPAVLAVAAPPTLARAGADFWNLDDARAELATQTTHAVVLADRDDVIMRRITIKEGLVAELITGRATLADVVAQFLELNESEPAYLQALRSTVPGDTDAERAARNVIEYAIPRAADPAARDELRLRLEAELDRMQDCDHSATP